MLFRSFFLWLILALPLAAQDLPAPLSDTISDYAGLLTPEQTTRLSDALRAGRAETGVQVVVAIMARISDHGGSGQRIEDYAKALFNQWGIGNAAHNDGILILVARDAREMRIALGSGYDVMWDNAAQRVIDRDILPAFRENRYADGIEAGIRGTYETIVRAHSAGQPAPVSASETPSVLDRLLEIVFIAVWVCSAVFLVLRTKISAFAFGLKRCVNCGARGQLREQKAVFAATKSTPGSAQERIFCPNCKHESTRFYETPSLSEGGSSGGFGGGSSSGGGATGRW